MTRITQAMLYARALRDVKSSLASSVRLQEQIASGRRVNRPSDDPSATLRILPLRAELRDLAQLHDNIQIARETHNLGAAALEDASTIMQRLRELTVQASNGTTSAGDLGNLGETLNQMLGQMLGIANTQRAGRYLFAGTASESAPFRLENSGRDQVRYAGNRDSTEFEVAPGLRTTIGTVGSEIFARHNRGPTSFDDGNTGARPSGAIDSGVGFGSLEVTFRDLAGAPPQITAGSGQTTALGPLSYSFVGGALSIDGGPSLPVPATNTTFTTGDGRNIVLTVSGTPVPAAGTMTARAGLSIDGNATTTLVDFGTSAVQVVDSRDGSVVNVDITALRRTGREAVTFSGTFDVFTLLTEMRDTLRSATQENLPQTRARIQKLMAEIDGAHDAVLDGLTSFGSRSEQMDMLTNRVESLTMGARESLSMAEDAELTESILKMNQQQLAYQASLQVSSRIVQTTLLDFLR